MSGCLKIHLYIMQTDAAPVPESTSVNLRDLYDTDSDSDSDIERPSYSPLSSVSSMEATSDYDGEDDDGDGDDDGLTSNGDTANDVSDGQEVDNDTEELETTVISSDNIGVFDNYINY